MKRSRCERLGTRGEERLSVIMGGLLLWFQRLHHSTDRLRLPIPKGGPAKRVAQQFHEFMMTNRLRKFVAVAWAIAWVGLTGGSATTVIPPSFEEMADRAELVFVGKAVASRAEWRTVGSDRAIFTLVEFQTQEVLKGTAGQSVILQFLGGTIGDATLKVTGVPRFEAGDRVILFVEKNGIQFSPLVGVFHGKFGLRKDQKAGHDIIVMHDGKVLRELAEIGAGEGAEFGPKRAKPAIAADREPMSADDFKTKVRDHLQKRAAQK